MKRTLAIVAAAAVFLGVQPYTGRAIDLAPKDSRSDLDKRMDAAKPAYDAQQREQHNRALEQEHPDPHAGRIRTGDSTSVSGSVDPGKRQGEVNLRVTH